jgi:three-Cys-motif partner protein
VRFSGEEGMLPESYKGREQAFIKHSLLKAYLERLLMIIGRYEQSICYVDCFAGPWQEESENLSDTSIAISLEILRKCHIALRRDFGRHVRFRALYIEKSKKAFEKLKSFLASQADVSVATECRNGEFFDLRHEILQWCGDVDFSFFFIDPKGWKKDIEVPTLSPFLKRGHSEFLVNFMYNFLVRAHSQPSFENDMKQIFGVIPDTTGMKPEEREEYLLRLYRNYLKREQNETVGKGARTAYVRVLDPRKDRTKYHLVYLTRHELGIKVFMEESEKLSIVQKRVRAQAKQNHRVDKTGQMELFSSSQIYKVEGEPDLSEIKRFWLDRLSFSPKRFDIRELADMIEEKDWFIGDFQKAFSQLETEGKVRNLDAKGKRTKNPIHFEKNERLEKVRQ